MEDKYTLYDQVLNECMMNLFLAGEKTQSLGMIGFNPKDKGHLLVMKLLSMQHYTFGYKITIDVNLFKYGQLLITQKCGDWLKRGKSEPVIDCEVFKNAIENFIGQPGFFKEIYEAYYERD